MRIPTSLYDVVPNVVFKVLHIYCKISIIYVNCFIFVILDIVMEAILAFFSSYFSYWPLVCFCALLLAGFNLPISEDVLIVMSALITHENKSLLIPNYLALYFGIYISDAICYWLGGLIAKGVFKLKIVTRALTPSKMEYIAKRLEKHGLLTFIVVRFIPFGMRNVLFLTSGFTGLPAHKFFLFDAIAAFLSSLSLYLFVLYLGASVKEGFKVIGIVLFVLVWGIALGFIIKKLIECKQKKRLPCDTNNTASTEQQTETDKKGNM